MRPRKPTPSYLTVLAGRSGPPANQPAEPVVVFPEPPAELPPRQQEIWRDQIARVPPGLLQPIDVALFAVWVAAIDLFEKASRRVSEDGLVVKGPNGGPMQNAYLAIQNRQTAILLKTGSTLGFTPLGRRRLKLSPPPPGKTNPFAALQQFDD